MGISQIQIRSDPDTVFVPENNLQNSVAPDHHLTLENCDSLSRRIIYVLNPEAEVSLITETDSSPSAAGPITLETLYSRQIGNIFSRFYIIGLYLYQNVLSFVFQLWSPL